MDRHQRDVELDMQRERALFWRVFSVLFGIGALLVFRTWMLHP